MPADLDFRACLANLCNELHERVALQVAWLQYQSIRRTSFEPNAVVAQEGCVHHDTDLVNVFLPAAVEKLSARTVVRMRRAVDQASATGGHLNE